MSYFRLSQNTFTRDYGEFGYMVHQYVKLSHVFKGNDQLYLRQLSRRPQSVDSVLERLQATLPGIDRQELESDLRDYLRCLESERHIVTGGSEEEMQAREIVFSYRNRPQKPARAQRHHGEMEDANTIPAFVRTYVRRHPLILGGHMDVTSRCNEDCVHCYYPHEVRRRTGQLIDTGLALSYLEQLAGHGTLSITFSGGEPFMHPEFPTLLRAARDNDLIVTVQSNGTLITDEHIEVLRSVRVSVVQISFYSLEAEIHDGITRTPGSFRKTLNAINRLLEADIPVAIQCFTMRENRASIIDMVRWGNARGVRVNTDFRMISQYDFAQENVPHALDVPQTRAMMEEAIATAKIHVNLDNSPVDVEKMAGKPICGIGIDQINLAANGDLYPCAGFHRYALGNLRESSLEAIWRGAPQLEKLRAVTWADFPQCLRCDAIKYCANCLARNYNTSGGNLLERHRHSCDIAFMNRDVVEQERRRRQGAVAQHGPSQEGAA